MSLENNKSNKDPKKGKKFNYYWIWIVILVAILGLNLFKLAAPVKQISQQEFFEQHLVSGDIESANLIASKSRVDVYIKEAKLKEEKYKEFAETKFGTVNKGPHMSFPINALSPESFETELKEIRDGNKKAKQVKIIYNNERNWMAEILPWIILLGLFALVWFFVMRRVSGGMGGAGGQIFNIGKSKAKLFDNATSKVNVTFNDVAGLEEAKEEVKEVVDFLKNPKKYTTLGGKIPKGVLLVGDPGTGKTLLAKAVAGEAKVPFFSISGSDFVEMFVGVGASRVRDLFKQAREKAPCIIFIDEIDAIGRARGKQMMQGNDERENTLNALLVEMDGFETDAGVIIMAASNRPDVLDKALLRPGRFDRTIGIDKPDLNGREAIFKVHLKPIKVAKSIDASKLAAQTPGFAGAEIANVCNEAALIAARKGKDNVEMDDFQDAIDRTIGGLEKKNKLISPEEKKIIAYHEAGHAICGWFLEHADPLVKVSIVPRGIAALGYAQYLPKEQYIMRTDQMLDRMCMALGGRAAEQVVFSEISTGAQNDLDRVTKTAYAMVSIYGMTEKIGNVSYYEMSQGEYSFSKPYSDETAKDIDDEARKIIEGQYDRAIALLNDKREELNKIAEELLDKEIIFKDDLVRLIGVRPIDAAELKAKDIAEKAEVTNITENNNKEVENSPNE